MTTRRSVLGALSLSVLPLVGCLSAPTAGSQTPSDAGFPDGNGDDGNSTRPEGTGGPGLTLASVDEQPAGPLEIDVAVTRDTATTDHPPGLRVTVTNTSDELVEVGEARAVVFQYQHSVGDALQLLPAGFEAPADADCWRLTEGIAVTQEYRTEKLNPGASMVGTLSLYAAAQSPEGTCLPVGEHRFEAPYTLSPGADEQQFTWGFSVLLE